MRKVMIVDDDKEFVDELRQALEEKGYTIIAVFNCAEVLDTAKNEKVDIILLDLKMTDGSGFKTASELKRSQDTTHIPLIAITGVYTDDKHILSTKLCGFMNRFIKPVNPLSIISAIEEALAK